LIQTGQIFQANQSNIFSIENDKNHPLNPMQHAYLKSRLTEIVLHDLVYKVDESLAQGKFALGIFFDVDGAFRNTSFESMGYAACWSYYT
jgi:hypothetical protein